MKKSEGGVRRDLLQFHPTDHRSMIMMTGQLIICLGQLSIFRDKHHVKVMHQYFLFTSIQVSEELRVILQVVRYLQHMDFHLVIL